MYNKIYYKMCSTEHFQKSCSTALFLFIYPSFITIFQTLVPHYVSTIIIVWNIKRVQNITF